MISFDNIEIQDEVSAGGFQGIIPANTKLECHVISAGWEPETKFANDHIVVKLHVTQPGPYKDFVVAHKLHVNDDSEKKEKKANEFLGSYDIKGKGLIAAALKAQKPITDALLSRALVGIGLIATFDTWERTIKDEKGRDTNQREPGGNWVRSIAPLSKRTQEQNRQVEKKVETLADIDFDDFDEIPFN